ncbi:hypothetical protein VTO42DRAFT_7516 [Malbranchea cinnamomea]
MSQTRWEKTKVYSKRGFDRAWNTLDKLGKPVNRLSNKVGAEAFWPTTLDKESDKAARILRSFCKDGFYDDITDREVEEKLKKGVREEDLNMPRGKQRVIKKIPASVIRNAKGLAIFTTMRTGLWVSGSGGSGVLVARIKETGEWSPPSGIMTHTVGLGFLVGVDIYDCVVVINTYEALESFKTFRCTLGGEVAAMTGPVGVGGVLDTEIHKKPAPVWTYIKGRGFYAGIEIAGTVIIERTDANAEFYGEKISVTDILAGNVKRQPSSISMLMQTLKAAQGDTGVDERMLPPAGGTPGDMEVVEKRFGIPDSDDPDPFGARALEAEGVMIREAGTRRIPSIETFEFRPSPKSPVYSARSRWSGDSGKLASWRQSIQSINSVDKGTQTDDDNFRRPGSGSSASQASSQSSRRNTDFFLDSTFEDESLSDDEPTMRSAKAQINSQKTLTVSDQTVIPTGKAVVTLTAPTNPSFTRAKLVTIPKRVPPPLPPRNPVRVVSASTPGSPLSEAGRTAVLSPSPGYDEDMKSLELTASLHKDNSHDFLSSKEDIGAASRNEGKEHEEEQQDHELPEVQKETSKEGNEEAETSIARQDQKQEKEEDKGTETNFEKEDRGQERDEDEPQSKKEIEGQDDLRQVLAILRPHKRKPVVQAQVEDEEEEEEFKSPVEQFSPKIKAEEHKVS